ncbi:hypothetical protein Pcinc_017723 [Petrolisthes cinctipes]|uniref:Uncharacterized protein n=1 Tax=Petrolisthes cinctipes TaxID=88211 RepID=A0AAE1FQ44_PETCI|nr:hypothetical protein Pcinc_017723 [Petrolisthes cinctipes]
MEVRVNVESGGSKRGKNVRRKGEKRKRHTHGGEKWGMERSAITNGRNKEIKGEGECGRKRDERLDDGEEFRNREEHTVRKWKWKRGDRRPEKEENDVLANE